MITYADEIVNQARAKIGCRETKVNSAACIYDMRAEVGLPLANEPWCAVFVLFCVQRASWRFGQISPFNKTASSIDIFNQAKKKGIKIDKRPSKGSLFFYYRQGGGHIGIVDSVKTNNKAFFTFEGNHNDQVSTVERQLSGQDYYFIHVEQLIKYSLPETDTLIDYAFGITGVAGAYLTWKTIFRRNKK